MSLEDFELINDTTIDNSILKRDFLKIYHQQGANLNNSDQNIEFIFGENSNLHQNGNAYLQYDITVRNHNNNDLEDGNVIRIMNNAFAYTFKEARLSTTGGSDLEDNKFVGQTSTIMRMLTS